MANEDTEKSYWDSVKQEALDTWESNGKDRDFAMDAISESCDGSYWVIYYHAARKCLEYSPNEDAVFDAGVSLDECDSMGALHCLAAYFAYRADCESALQDLIDEHESADEESEEASP